MQLKALASAVVCALYVIFAGGEALAAGTLKDSSTGAYATIVDHAVHVVLNNGFARTEVSQVFQNDASTTIDAIYEFPIPKDAALSEMKIELSDRTMYGKVVPREEAEKIYATKKSQGQQAGLATKDGHQNFRFSIANIPAQSQAIMTFVYYEPLNIEDAVGRYLYPLQDGGTASSPWSGNQTVTGTLSFELELKSMLPIIEVDMPGFSPTINMLGAGHYQVSLKLSPAELSQDLVLQYRFPNDLERRLELVRHRPSLEEQGTFMAILTPGLDLQPITTGTDYVFVLDISGSMAGKLASLKIAVSQALDELKEGDRFRILKFNDAVFDVSGGWRPVTPSSISNAKAAVNALFESGSTNVYAGLKEGLTGLDSDRVTTLFLITDAETNTGIIDAASFDQLVRTTDVRVHGLLMSNNANWPLMQVISEASGGFFSEVSNQDDIAQRIQLAFDKATHEALHGVELDIAGNKLSETTEFRLSKVYKGQQLILFGRYAEPGDIDFTLKAKLSGQPEVITKSAYLPDIELDNREIVQLWALDMVHAIERQRLLGLITASEAKTKITKYGVDHQLVTDYTAMIVVDDESFSEPNAASSPPGGDSPPPGSGSPPPSSGSYGGGSGYYGDDDYAGALDAGHFGLFALFALGLVGLWLAERRRAGAWPS